MATTWSARATTYDAAKDFSLAADPNGVWSYGILSQLPGGTFSAFTFKDSGSDFTGSQARYNGQAVPNDAAVEANTSGQTQSITVGNGMILIPADQFNLTAITLKAGTTLGFVESPNVYHNDSTGLSVTVTTVPAFFTGQVALNDGVYYLASPANGNIFGYYSYLNTANYIYHFDLRYEYLFDANDGQGGVYFYDFKSQHFFYTAPRFPFPYLYDFSLNTTLYYYPDPSNPGRYNTDGVRYFYNFATGQIITQ